MEEDDTNNIVKDDGINRFIQDIFALIEDKFDDIHDVPLFEKS